MRARRRTMLALLLVMGLGACAESEPAPVEQVDYATEVQPIWEGSCTCHFNPVGGGEAQAAPDTDLRLNAELALGLLVEVESEDVEGMNRIEPGAPAESYLWHKINDTHLGVGGAGDAMPPSLVLDDAQFDTIERWILGL